LALDCDLGFQMMPNVKATIAYKNQSILKEFPEEFMKSPNNELYCNLCSCTVSCSKRFLVDSHRKTTKHQKALCRRSEQLISPTSQTFLKSSDTDFVEKVTKAFLSADVPLYKLNNKHIKSFFCDIGHSLPSETTCRRTVLQLSADELQQIGNAVHDKQIFWLLMRALCLAHSIWIFSLEALKHQTSVTCATVNL